MININIIVKTLIINIIMLKSNFKINADSALEFNKDPCSKTGRSKKKKYVTYGLDKRDQF